MQNGLHRNVSPEDYYSHPAISKSGLDLVHRAPAIFKYHQTQPRIPTPAMRFGAIYHLAILEPSRFAVEVVSEPEDAPKRPSQASYAAAKPQQKTLDAMDYWREFDTTNATKIIIDAAEAALVADMRAALMSNKGCRLLIEVAKEFESSIFWTDRGTGLQCRSRLDGIAAGFPIDLKTTVSAAPEDFARSIYDRRYHVQAAMYSDGFEAATKEKPRAFAFIAQEKTAPYMAAVYVASDDMMRAGRAEYQRDLETYAQCVSTDTWPGYSEKAEPINLPPWAMKALEA